MAVAHQVAKLSPDIKPPGVNIIGNIIQVSPGEHVAPDGSLWKVERMWHIDIPAAPTDVWIVKTVAEGRAVVSFFNSGTYPPIDNQVDRLVWYEDGDYHYIEFV